jgi:hypothetical protein
MCAMLGVLGRTGRSGSFLKKRTKKLFDGCRRSVRDRSAKVLLLFSKRSAALCEFVSAPCIQNAVRARIRIRRNHDGDGS